MDNSTEKFLQAYEDQILAIMNESDSEQNNAVPCVDLEHKIDQLLNDLQKNTLLGMCEKFVENVFLKKKTFVKIQVKKIFSVFHKRKNMF